MKGSCLIPCYFIDSTQYISPFMHKKGMFKMNKNLHFLGRSGILEQDGIRIAYVSGKDSEILGPSISSNLSPSLEYMSNYFCQADIATLMTEKPVDILLCCQYPVGVFNIPNADFLTRSSSSLSILVHKLSPRYVYCATDLECQESETFLNERGCLTRCITLANLLGSYKKPKESTMPYIKAIEISTEFNDEIQGV